MPRSEPHTQIITGVGGEIELHSLDSAGGEMFSLIRTRDRMPLQRVYGRTNAVERAIAIIESGGA